MAPRDSAWVHHFRQCHFRQCHFRQCVTRVATGGRAPYISGKQEGISLVDQIAGVKMRVALMDDDLLDQDT
eukprot:426380-Amphidinium_carterae.1